MSRRKFIKNTFLGSIAASGISFNHKDSNLKKFKTGNLIDKRARFFLKKANFQTFSKNQISKFQISKFSKFQI